MIHMGGYIIICVMCVGVNRTELNDTIKVLTL